MRPVLFELGPGFRVHAYGLLVALGMLAGVAVAVAEHRRTGGTVRSTLSAALVALAGAFVGGRLLFALVVGPAGLLRGGTVFLGGLLGGAGALVAWSLVRRVPLPRLLDAFALGVPIGHALGRAGCFFAGCCFGKAWLGPFGARFPEGSLAYLALVESGAVRVGASATPPLFPSQLAEAACELALGLALILWRGRKRFHGQLALVWLGGYGVVRFVLELFRGDHAARGYLFTARLPSLAHALALPAGEPLLLSTSQAIGLVLLAVALSCGALVSATRRP